MWVYIGSPMSSIGGIDVRPISAAGYSASKLFAHWFTKKIAQEHEDFISFVLDSSISKTNCAGFELMIWVIGLCRRIWGMGRRSCLG
jgi:hypothetical protein